MSRSTHGGPAAKLRTDHLTVNEQHRLVGAAERRLALGVLAERLAPIALAELAADVATRTGDAPVSEADTDRLATLLHHVHLPKMDAMGVIDYDPETHVVDPQPGV